MKTFDALFTEAAEISDKRKAIFNQLIEKTEREIIPNFAKVLENYDLGKSYFTIYVCPVAGFVSQRDEDGDNFWVIGIENNGRIWDASKDIYKNKFETFKEYRTRLDESDIDIPVANFRRSAIVQLVNKINNRIEELNKKYSSKIEEAESLLK